jgi:hypothetical protein
VPVEALAHSISTGPKTCYNKRTQAKKMSTPNWQHNSGKSQKRKLKPQKLRQAKKRLKNWKSKYI